VAVLTWIVVAPVSRTARGIPTEVALGPAHGLREDCVATFDNLQPIRRSFLTGRVGPLGPEERSALRGTLRAFADR
jgi:mRNA interferase MazF